MASSSAARWRGNGTEINKWLGGAQCPLEREAQYPRPRYAHVVVADPERFSRLPLAGASGQADPGEDLHLTANEELTLFPVGLAPVELLEMPASE